MVVLIVLCLGVKIFVLLQVHLMYVFIFLVTFR